MSSLVASVRESRTEARGSTRLLELLLKNASNPLSTGERSEVSRLLRDADYQDAMVDRLGDVAARAVKGGTAALQFETINTARQDAVCAVQNYQSETDAKIVQMMHEKHGGSPSADQFGNQADTIRRRRASGLDELKEQGKTTDEAWRQAHEGSVTRRCAIAELSGLFKLSTAEIGRVLDSVLTPTTKGKK